MKRLNYFFRRKEFKSPEVKKPFYEYLGYFVEKSDGTKLYPVSVYFGRDEISLSFTVRGRIHKVFSLYVAKGELNQKKLSSQIENYWKMYIWPLKKNVGELLKNGTESESMLQIDPQLLSSGAFGKYCGINITDDNKFVENNLFKERGKKKDFEISDDGLQIRFSSYKKDSEKPDKEKWKLKGEILTTNKINFKKILLDFLFELEFANTFEDKNFFQLQPVLQDNKVLDALTRKNTYLLELYHLKDHQQETKKPKLPLKFRKAEKEWLNVCFLESYRDVFTSGNSIFKTTEEEAELVLFKTRIGVSSRDRSELFTKDDVNLRNRSATFFLRKYSIYRAFRTLLHPAVIYLLPVLLLLIPFGDFCLNLLDDPLKQFVGVSSIGIPIMMLAALIVRYALTRINLFKLLVPRLFLGIMIGWSIFWSTEALWKSTVIAEAGKIVVVNSVLFVLIYLYVFTDIRNKLVRVREAAVLKKAAVLVLFAMLISFVQGFYVLQFQAKPMLENSGFLTSDNPKLFDKKNISAIKDIKITGMEHSRLPNSLAIAKITHEVTANSKDHEISILESGRQEERALFKIKNFSMAKLFADTKLYYIWSVHLSQFMVSILIGIVLQLLWEDRPITEPL